MSATASDPSTWTPVGETSTDILNDSVNLISAILCGLGYGIVLTLYFLCARILYTKLKKRDAAKQAGGMLMYITILTISGGLYLASTSRVVQDAYVNFRNYPTGPYNYTLATFSYPDNLLGVVTYFITNWMTDAVLIWRVYVLYKVKSRPALVIAFPCVLYLASFAMGVVIIYESSRPNQSFWSTVSVPFGLAYYSLTAALTIIATILMTFRLMTARNQHMETMGNTSYARQYFGIATMLIESSALYAIWSIIFIGLYAANHPMQTVFLCTLTDVSIIALLLIIFRVSQGRAWKADTEQTLASVDRRIYSYSNGGSNKEIKRFLHPTDSSIHFADPVIVQTSTTDKRQDEDV